LARPSNSIAMQHQSVALIEIARVFCRKTVFGAALVEFLLSGGAHNLGVGAFKARNPVSGKRVF
jgi:hypothetical protein